MCKTQSKNQILTTKSYATMSCLSWGIENSTFSGLHFHTGAPYSKFYQKNLSPSFLKFPKPLNSTFILILLNIISYYTSWFFASLYILIYQWRHIDHFAFYICLAYSFRSDYSISLTRYAPSQARNSYKIQKDLPLVIMKVILHTNNRNIRGVVNKYPDWIFRALMECSYHTSR